MTLVDGGESPNRRNFCHLSLGPVLAINAIGVTTVTPPTPPAPTAAPTMVSTGALLTPLVPADDASVKGSSFTLSWHASHLAASYDVQLWLVRAAVTRPLDPTLSTLVSRHVSTASVSIATAGLVLGLYRWRVAATDRTGTLIRGWTTDQRLVVQKH